MAKKAVKPKRKLTRSQRLNELKAFIQLCFMAIDEPDPKEVCNMTGLSLRTIYRLSAGQVSLATHIGTVQAIGLAAGLWLDMESLQLNSIEARPKRVVNAA